MVSDTVIELSQWQYIISVSVHFLFVPLTVGLSLILAIMESAYVLTGREVYLDMTQFWGKIFGINFVMGIITSLTLAFQLGMNGAFFSHFVGDVFAAPLVICGLFTFFMELTFVGLFFFGWGKLPKGQHLIIIWLVALGSNFSLLWFLMANGWMQHPVGAEFNYETMRMELGSFTEVIFNPVAQVKSIHTLAAAYTAASSFVLAISSYYLLKGRDTAFSQRSYTIAAGLGLASIFAVIITGNESSYFVAQVQKAKFAAIEAEWLTEKSPAAYTIFGYPDQQEMVTHDEVQIPALLGLVGTHSFDTPIIGLTEIMENNRKRIFRGIKAYTLLQQLREGNKEESVLNAFKEFKNDLGYGLLLKRYTNNVVDATSQQIALATKASIPQVTAVFWALRIMIMCGGIILLVFIVAVFSSSLRKRQRNWVLWLSVFTLPLSWIASESGWIVSELGRQPWLVVDALPSFLGLSLLSEWDLIISLVGYIIFYTVFLFFAISLMMKAIKLGPSSLHRHRYHFEVDEGNLP